MRHQAWIFVAALTGCGSTTATTGSDMSTSVLPADLTMAAAPDCAGYCATIMANCKGDGSDGGMGANQQYTTLINCMNSCKAMPVGSAADRAGNTLGCRSYHAMAAKGDPVLHCPHAGPGGAGVCGANCDGYCQIAMMYCTASNMAKVYSDLNDCKTTCMSVPDDARYSIAVQEGPHQACLLYHVQEASTVPPDHCLDDLAKGDGGIKSVTCM